MFEVFLLGFAFGLIFLFGRRSLADGILAVIGVGYFYGIIRANIPTTMIYFLFDVSVLGLYVSQFSNIVHFGSSQRVRTLKLWVVALILWPLFVFFFPIQDFMVQLVGLRGNVFLLPFLLLGGMLERKDLDKIALGFCWLNLVALAFAVAEFSLGVPRFYPRNNVTEIIYRSNDLLHYTAYRIPATFANAHAYAGTMVMTLPFLIGAWVQHHSERWKFFLLAAAITATILGVFMSAARVHFLVAFLLVVVTTFSIPMRISRLIGWLVMIIGISWAVSSQERLQRFTSLRDTDYVVERIGGSVNMNFFDLAYEYPLGNGMGGGGTSLPYFLQDRLRKPIMMENEYARIMLEQGMIGLYLWIMFILWFLTRRTRAPEVSWFLARRLAWCASLSYFVSGLIGTGLLTSIPQTCLLLSSVGWVAVPERTEELAPQTDSHRLAIDSGT